jgi:Tol biopolymer transport system component
MRGAIFYASVAVALLALMGRALADDEEGGTRRGEQGFRAIYWMNRDGSRVKYLCAAPGMISSADPQWSHDGKMIAFDGVPEIQNSVKGKIYVHALEGPFKGAMVDLGYGITPAWSPDDRQIAFVIYDGNPGGEQGGTWIMNSDGTNRHRVAAGWFPRFSPDGKRLVCHRYEAPEDLLIVDLEHDKTHSLLGDKGWQLQTYDGCDWSPDGKQIAFCGTLEGKDRLATVDVADDKVHILYTNDDDKLQFQGPPTWSRDGKEIVFVREDKEQGPRQWWKSYLYSISTAGGAEPKLVEGKKVGNINRGMAFSPDGSKLMFSSER